MLARYEPGRCYIIAEIGGNFTELEQAKRLIDAAAECKVDAVKLQTYRADTLSTKDAIFEMENTGRTSQYDLFKKYEIGEGLHREVFAYAAQKQLDCFSTPSHETDVDLLERLGIAAYKIGSDDAANLPFLRHVARIGKPIILSTGMCTMDEVKEAVGAILGEGNSQLTLLHAITSYPTHPEHVNLLAMVSMIREFPELRVGYSDHTIGTTACVCAVAMGARVVEKHFTYSKSADGPDHMLSSDPEEMRELVGAIRDFEAMRGNGIKQPADSERTTRINNRKSLVVTSPVRAGDSISLTSLAIKRPGRGIQPKYLNEVAGRVAKRNLDTDHILTWDDLR